MGTGNESTIGRAHGVANKLEIFIGEKVTVRGIVREEVITDFIDDVNGAVFGVMRIAPRDIEDGLRSINDGNVSLSWK